MTPDEFQRYKEAEKAHLRKLKELKKAVHTLERQKSVSAAAHKIAEGQDLFEKQKGLVDELAMETARHEARLEIALESAEEAGAPPANTAALEEELQRERAQALVRQLKRQMSANDADDVSPPVESRESPSRLRGENLPDQAASRKQTASGSANRNEGDRVSTREPDADAGGRAVSGRPTKGRDDRPEKTIGRM